MQRVLVANRAAIGVHIVAAALARGSDAVHPGYGSCRNAPELAEACEENGLIFAGPPGGAMWRSGDKFRSRDIASLETSVKTSRLEAEMAFGDGTVSLERDCSAQRRHHQLIDEAPAVSLPPGVLEGIPSAAVALARELDNVRGSAVYAGRRKAVWPQD